MVTRDSMDTALKDLRPYRQGDMEKLTELVLEAGAYPPTGPLTTKDLISRWERWHVNPEQDISILPNQEGDFLAFSRATLVTEPSARVSMAIAVRPDMRRQGIGSAIYSRIEQHTYALGVSHVTTPVFLRLGETHSDYADFLLKRDFFPDRSFWQMRIDHIAAQRRPEWPEGIGVRQLVPDLGDAERWAKLVQEVFSEPTTAERILTQLGESGHSPEGYFFAVEQATGREIGTSRARIDFAGGQPIGYVGTVGVLPAYRHKGLATALIAQALKYLATQDLDSAVLFVADENDTARRLYDKLGWRHTYRTVHYWKRLF